MASIIKNEEQIKALQEVEENLETIKQLNQVIASGGQGAFIGITPAKGKPLKVEVNEKDRKSVVALCSKIRERATRETLAKAEKYHISLNDEEVKVLTPSKTSATTE